MWTVHVLLKNIFILKNTVILDIVTYDNIAVLIVKSVLEVII